MGFHVACGLGSCYACGLDCQYTACLLLVVFDREAGRYDRHDETGGLERLVCMAGFIGGKAARVF